MRRLICVFAVLALAVASAQEEKPPPGPPPGPRPQRSSDEDDSRQRLARKLKKSAVSVFATSVRERRDAAGVERYHFTTSLSGFVLDDKGHIVTVAHAVRDAEQLTVMTDDGKRLKAKLVGEDRLSNVAVLKVDPAGAGLRAVEMGGDGGVGRRVVVVSSPLGLRNSVAFGYVAGEKRTLVSRGRLYSGMLQLSVPPSLADPGGLVADFSGRVVGMVAPAYIKPPAVERLEESVRSLAGKMEVFLMLAKRVLKDEDAKKELEKMCREMGRFLFPERLLEGLPSASVTFAVTADTVGKAARRVLAREKRAWLGVRVRHLSPQERGHLRLEGGLVVEVVFPGSPAEKAGVRRNDIILALGGREVNDLSTLQQFLDALSPGQTVEFGLLREGKKEKVKVTLGTR